MTDDEFLWYVHHHSETDRALFSCAHVYRLYDLAGIERPKLLLAGWYAVHEDVANPLVQKARDRQNTLAREATPQERREFDEARGAFLAERMPPFEDERGP